MDFVTWLHSLGYLGIWAIIFAETGLLFGVFLPGDTLLFAAGVLAGQGAFNIWVLAGGCFAVAFLGNIFGYWLGARYGIAFARRYASRFITEDHIQKTQYLFDKYGHVAMILSRFLPVARTVAPFLAGAAGMNKQVFMLYSLLGAVVWGFGLPFLGYAVGDWLPAEALHYLAIPVILIILGLLMKPYLTRKKD